MVRPEQIHVH